MKITDTDYKVMIGEESLKVLSRCSAATRHMAERQAIAELSGYLRPTFAPSAVFAAEGDDRHPQILMYVCDIALYNMAASLPQRMGMEIRKERYDRAIEWCKGVSKGEIVPDLPTPRESKESGAEGEKTASTGTIAYHSAPKLRNDW